MDAKAPRAARSPSVPDRSSSGGCSSGGGLVDLEHLAGQHDDRGRAVPDLLVLRLAQFDHLLGCRVGDVTSLRMALASFVMTMPPMGSRSILSIARGSEGADTCYSLRRANIGKLCAAAVSLWVFWLRTSIFLGFQPRPAAIRKIGLRACRSPGALVLAKIRRRRSVSSLEGYCCTSCKTGASKLPMGRCCFEDGGLLVSYRPPCLTATFRLCAYALQRTWKEHGAFPAARRRLDARMGRCHQCCPGTGLGAQGCRWLLPRRE